MPKKAREVMDFDVVIVGGGPAGLATACKLTQLAAAANMELSLCLVEKGSEIGAHIISGAIMEPKALDELYPDWKKADRLLAECPVTEDHMYYLLNSVNRIKLPNFLVPKDTHNIGNFAISLGNLCRWLGSKAEQAGVNIFPGCAAAEILYNSDGSVAGVATGDMGVDKDNKPRNNFQRGYELRAKYTVFAEGCRGNLGKQLIAKFNLNKNIQTQHYALGLKELWEVEPRQHKPGMVVHTLGWPLSHGKSCGGGAFLYHFPNNKIAVGLIVDLSYRNPYLDPFEEFQRYKKHPLISQYLENGNRISYGARAIVKGGLNALVKSHAPGALLIGDDAGFLNPLKIKGTHTAIKSGSLAAETLFPALLNGDAGTDLDSYTENFRNSWLYDELYAARNTGPALHRFGVLPGAVYTWAEQTFMKGQVPYTISDPKPDHETLIKAEKAKKIDYPKPDGILTFDKLSSVYLSNTNHEENQPCHLHLHDQSIPILQNLPMYVEPAQRYCPASVYEVVQDGEAEPKFVINAANCVHCKTCDIKDPAQNITWLTPEGAGGPNYSNM